MPMKAINTQAGGCPDTSRTPLANKGFKPRAATTPALGCGRRAARPIKAGGARFDPLARFA